ncbi:glycosyltransferase family 9 protein [Tistrella mobilis]
MPRPTDIRRTIPLTTMRRLDRYLGAPLCAIVSLLRPLLDLAARGRHGAQPRRILFIELSEMGSTVLADPAIRLAQARHDAEAWFVIFAGNAASLDLTGTIPPERVFTIRTGNLIELAGDTLRFLVWARRNSIDTVIDLELFSRFTALLTGLSGARHRVGFHRFTGEGLYRGNFLTHRVAYNPHLHVAKSFVALVDALSRPAGERPMTKRMITDDEVRLVPRAEDPAAMATLRSHIDGLLPASLPAGAPLLLINPHASDLLPQRRWPLDHFDRLIRQVLELRPELAVLITGAAADAAIAGRLCRMIEDPRVIDLSGRIEISGLPTLYRLACAMVTNDSGPAHFAAVAGLPTVVLYGPETPVLYAPLGPGISLTAGLACSPCVSAANHRNTPCTDPVCMREIAPARVLSALMPLLDGAGSRRTSHHPDREVEA